MFYSLIVRNNVRHDFLKFLPILHPDIMGTNHNIKSRYSGQVRWRRVQNFYLFNTKTPEISLAQ